MYSAFTPGASSLSCAPPHWDMFGRALQSDRGASAAITAPPAQRPQHQQEQHHSRDGRQLVLQEQQHAVESSRVLVGGNAANPGPESGPAEVRGRQQQRLHRWDLHTRGHRIRANTNSTEDKQASDGSPRQMQEGFPSSPSVTAQKPGFLARLLRPGRGEQKRSHSLPQSGRSGDHQQDEAAHPAERSLTPPASATAFLNACSDAVFPSEEKGEQSAPLFTPRHRPRHWFHHQKWKHHQEQTRDQQEQHHPSLQQQQQGSISRTPAPGLPHHVQAPPFYSRRSPSFASATFSVPLNDQTTSERRLGTVTTALPLSVDASCMAHPVFVVPGGIPACQHGFMRPGHPANAISRHVRTFPQHEQQHQVQPLFTAGGGGPAVNPLRNRFSSNGSRVAGHLLPSYMFEKVAASTTPRSRYKNPSSFTSTRSSFGLCSPVAGCFPAPNAFAVRTASEGTTAPSAFPSTQMVVQTPAVAVGGLNHTVTAAGSLARATEGGGKATIDPEAFNTFNASCFFTQLYLLDSAKRLELTAARISHSMQSRAFSYWVLKHRYPIAKQIWNRKVLNEVAHLNRLQNNLERSRQNYAAETARKRSEADAGAIDKSAELLIIQEQQREALAELQAAADEQLQRVERYKARRGAVLGSLVLEHSLKRLLYNYKAFSLFALRSNLLTYDDILQQAIRMLPKFLPPAWKQLDPTRQAELLKSEYAHLVDPATIHLTNLREMYRLHRLDLEARTRTLGRYYRRFFAMTRSFAILECTQRSQRRRLVSDAFALLRHYSWMMRAIQEESVACNAVVARLRGVREYCRDAASTSEGGNPLVFPFYHRRRRNVCTGCRCTSPHCSCGNIATTGTCRPDNCGPFTSCTSEESERTAHGTVTVTSAALDRQNDAAVKHHTQHLRPSRTCTAVAGRDEMSGIFFSRYSDGSPVPPRKERYLASGYVHVGGIQHNSNTDWRGSAGCAGGRSRRGTPTERCSCCSGSSADVQVSCSCCGQAQREDTAIAHNSGSNAAHPSRGMFSNSERSVSPATMAAPRPCVSCSSPETAETDTAGAATAIHQRCGTEGSRTEESCTLHGSESLWAHGSAATRQNEASSRIPSPSCPGRGRHLGRACSIQDGNAQLCFTETTQRPQHQPPQSPQQEEQQQRQRQQAPEVHQSCFLEGGAMQANRLRRGSSSPACLGRFSPKAASCAAMGNRSFSWPHGGAHATSQHHRQPLQAHPVGEEAVHSQDQPETRLDIQKSPACPATGVNGAAAIGCAGAGLDGTGTAAEKECTASLITSVQERQMPSDPSAAPVESPYLRRGLSKSRPVTASGIHTSTWSAAAGVSPSAVGAALPSTGAAQEVERNAALILSGEPQLRSSSSGRPASIAPAAATVVKANQGSWHDTPKPGEDAEVGKVHLVGRRCGNRL